jgi:hypothetical protein
MVGVSRDPKDFSRQLFRDLCARGYDMVPVNLRADEVEGRDSYQCLQVIRPAVEGALLMTSPQATEAVVRDCVEAGIRNVWMYRARRRWRGEPRGGCVLPEPRHSSGGRTLPIYVLAGDSFSASSARICDEADRTLSEGGVRRRHQQVVRRLDALSRRGQECPRHTGESHHTREF